MFSTRARLAYLPIFIAVLAGCGGSESVEIPTPAALDGRSFRAQLASGGHAIAPTGYESTQAFELRAQVNPPPANRSDLKWIPREGESSIFPLFVVRSTMVADGDFRLKPERVSVILPGRELAPFEYGELSNSFLAELGRTRVLAVPVLSDGRRLYRPKTILLRGANGSEQDLSHLLEQGADGKTVTLIPLLKNDEAIAHRKDSDRVVVAFETIAIDSAEKPSPVRPWLDSKRPGEQAAALMHPGDNTHVKELVDRALGNYRTKFAKEAISMIDFVEKFRIADCKMVALAAVQKTSSQKGGADFRAFVVSGNRVEASGKIDLVTSNHAWTAAIDGTKASTLTMEDFTPESKPEMEFLFDASTLRWSLEQLQAATTREDFAATLGRGEARAATVPASMDPALQRLALRRLEDLLPSSAGWQWDGTPLLTIVPEVRSELVRKNRITGERVSININAMVHPGRRGENVSLREGSAPLNPTKTATLERFNAEVTALNRGSSSSSTHNKEHYWTVSLLFYALR